MKKQPKKSIEKMMGIIRDEMKTLEDLHTVYQKENSTEQDAKNLLNEAITLRQSMAVLEEIMQEFGVSYFV